MDAKIRIETVHILKLSCPGCPDRAEYDITTSYCRPLPEFVEEFGIRHAHCVEKVAAQIAEKEAQARTVKVEPVKPSEALRRFVEAGE